MKKGLVCICLVLVCVCALCACTPDAGELREAYKGAGYDFQPFEPQTAGAEDYELIDSFSAVKGANGELAIAYVLLFATLGEARDFEKDHAADADKAGLTRIGKIIVYGSEQAVQIATGE